MTHFSLFFAKLLPIFADSDSGSFLGFLLSLEIMAVVAASAAGIIFAIRAALPKKSHKAPPFEPIQTTGVPLPFSKSEAAYRGLPAPPPKEDQKRVLMLGLFTVGVILVVAVLLELKILGITPGLYHNTPFSGHSLIEYVRVSSGFGYLIYVLGFLLALVVATWGISAALFAFTKQRSGKIVLGLLLSCSIFWLVPILSWGLNTQFTHKLAEVSNKPTTYDTQKAALNKDQDSGNLRDKILNLPFTPYLPKNNPGFTVRAKQAPTINQVAEPYMELFIDSTIGLQSNHSNIKRLPVTMASATQVKALLKSKGKNCIRTSNEFDGTLSTDNCSKILTTPQGITVYGTLPNYHDTSGDYYFIKGETAFTVRAIYAGDDANSLMRTFVDSLQPVSKQDIIDYYGIK